LLREDFRVLGALNFVAYCRQTHFHSLMSSACETVLREDFRVRGSLNFFTHGKWAPLSAIHLFRCVVRAHGGIFCVLITLAFPNLSPYS